MCIRCHERQAFGDRGYCITCVWAVQVEVEQGMNRLQDYLRTNMRSQERLSLLPVYHSRGYLKAQFADSQAKVADDGAQTLVDGGLSESRV